MTQPNEEPPSLNSDIEKKTEQPLEVPQNEPERIYPSGIKLFIIIISLLSAMFLVSLDRTIIATAIPRITDDFHSLQDIGWYGSSYMAANAAVQLVYGRIYKFYDTKWIFLVSITVFEIGSFICGIAPSSIVLIIGRAISGFGSSGVMSGVLLIMSQTVPLHKRAMYNGFFFATFGLASVAGPLLGGLFTEDVSWRWCFYINLPIGFCTIVVIAFILKLDIQLPGAKLTFREQLQQLDPIGTAVFLPCIICLILALQWGGSKYAWSDGKIIALLTLFSALLVLFLVIQWWKGENATIPPRIIKQRSIAAGFYCATCGSAATLILIYYLPIYFQAIKNSSALESGVQTIPLVLSLVVGSILSGFVTSKIGYYTASQLASPFIISIGTGLLTTITVNTTHAKLIGYQIIAGIGFGASLQQPSLAVQTVLAQSDVSIGLALVLFAQQLSGALFLAVGQNLFQQRLDKNLAGIAGLSASNVTSHGATELRKFIPPQLLPVVLVAYNDAIKRTFVLATIMGALVIIGALLMEWRSIKQKQGPSKENPLDAMGQGDIEKNRIDDVPQSSGGGSDKTAIHVEQAADQGKDMPSETKNSSPSEAESVSR